MPHEDRAHAFEVAVLHETREGEAVLNIEKSEQIGDLVTALVKARKKFDPIVKDKVATVRNEAKNTEYRYKYADLADVLDSTAGPLADEGLILIQPPVNGSSGRASVFTMLMHTSGQFIAGSLDLPSLGEKATPQQFGSLVTYWRRYSACSFLGITSQFDDDDGKAASIARQAETMDASKLADFLAAIEAAEDDDGLKAVYQKAEKAAGKDRPALARIAAAKTARWKTLEARRRAVAGAQK